MKIQSTVLKAAETNNFIVIAGINDDEVKSILSELKERYVEEAFSEFDYIEMYGDELDIEQFSQSVLASPMVSERKVIVIKNGSQLNAAQCREMNTLADSAAEGILALIVYTDSSKYHNQIVKKAKELFTNAFVAELRKKRELNKKDIMEKSNHRGINISSETASRMESVSDGNPEIINNLISTAWMVNDEQTFDNILSDDSGFDIAPVMHSEFIQNFSMCNAKKCFEIYRQLIKWHVLSPDGLLIILLNHLQKMRNPSMNRFPIHMDSAKWTNSEIDKAYFLFYNVLRNFRTLRREYAVLTFEQVLVNVLNS